MAKKRTEAEVTFIANDDGLKSTLKEISAELTKNRAELKLEQAQLQQTGSESDKLGSKLSSLEKQYELQSQKVEVTSLLFSQTKISLYFTLGTTYTISRVHCLFP